MKSYKFINNVGGWVIFAIAAITYYLTIEPTASFWDCSEFITTSYKMEVGHPPGDPLFMLLGRFFSLFAFGNVAHVAKMINILSATASAFTILFLFWSITHIAKRIIAKTKNLELGEIITIIGSGVIGALAYTWSDTFWFSAVEGEVYASSSFFTAIVFWLILKWENEADQKYANRWIILIAYLMGLSIGIHLLNLLAIPAIVFIYYFKKYEVTKKGVIYAGLISVFLLGFIMYGVIQGVIIVGSLFERGFTNSFGLPYNTGFIFYILLIGGGIIFGIYYTLKKNLPIVNTVLTGILVILIGYSSFSIVLIRSKADTPMNQNKPDNVFDLISYLNRDQYGDSPLAYGQYFNAPPHPDKPYTEISKDNYIPRNHKYIVIDHKYKHNYDPEYMTLFPRMYSDQASPDHVAGYLSWLGENESEFYYPKKREDGSLVQDRYGDYVYDHNNPKRSPTFIENLRYFFGYQLKHMYLRYFMWNFVGRQNDTQGHGGIQKGNWISGITFLDELRLGNQSKITSEMKNNKGRNKYFFLPLILGLIGMFFLLSGNLKSKKYFWVIMMFFFFTGVAIVLYLNQPPFQPRERDYAYAGSFYVFAMYIGFGVAGITKFLRKYMKYIPAAATASLISLVAPVIMAQQNWDDHDRSNRYTTSDYAKNYLSSCEKNAIIFTNGDNDTFPLWYIQEVEGFRTDIRVINLSYFNTDWYINQMRKKAYESEPVKFTLSPEKYQRGSREGIQKWSNPNIYLDEKYEGNKYKLETEYKALYDSFIEYLGTTNFTEKFTENYAELKKGHTLLSPYNYYGFIQKLTSMLTSKELNIDKAILAKHSDKAVAFLHKISGQPLPIKTFIAHIGSDDPDLKTPPQEGYPDIYNYMPTTKITIPVDKKQIKKYHVVAEKDMDKVLPAVSWDLKKGYIQKNEMMVLDMLAANNWERPIYFATTVGGSSYMKLTDFFQQEGLAYRVVPIKAKANKYVDEGRVNTDILYRNVMEKFVWGGLDSGKDLYLDENNRRFIMNFKSIFKNLAGQLVLENKKDSAEKVLDKCTSIFTNKLDNLSYYDMQMAELYYKIGKDEKGDNLIKILDNNYTEELTYYFSLSDRFMPSVNESFGRTIMLAQEMIKIIKRNGRTELAKKIALKYTNLINTKFNFDAVLSSANTQQQQEAFFGSLPEAQQRAVFFYLDLQKLLVK